jgi:hypothetical protein
MEGDENRKRPGCPWVSSFPYQGEVAWNFFSVGLVTTFVMPNEIAGFGGLIYFL